ncbi:MAG: hypothetical protein ACC707_08415 [Thiohalomonadales bacterium]
MIVSSQKNANPDWPLYGLIFASLLSCVPLWLVDYLPSIDLPQHAAQVAVMLNYGDVDSGYQDIFRMNWFTPYLFGYGILYLLGLVLPLSIAAKLLLSISFIATLFLSRALLQQYGSDKNLAWLIIPINYSFAFYWGFFTFIVSIPFFLLYLLAVHRYLQAPTRKQGIILGIGSIGLFFSHFILFGLAMLIAALQTFFRYDIKQYRLYLHYFTAAPIVIAWFVKTMTSEQSGTSTVWNLGFYRIPQIFSYIIGMQERWPYVIVGIMMVVLPFIIGGRLTRLKWKWAPVIILLLIFFFVPMLMSGVLFVYERVVILLYIFYLLLFEFKTPLNFLKSSFAALFALALMVMVLMKFIAFDQENAGFKDLINAMPVGKRVLFMVFKTRSSEFAYHPIYLNFPAWYQVEKGGVVDFNFANLYPVVVRFRDDKKPKFTLATLPKYFDWNKHDGDMYDYILIRSEHDVQQALFRENAYKVRLEKRVGLWWLYKNIQH